MDRWPTVLTHAIIAAQRKAVPHAQVLIARQSSHPLLVRDPEPALVEANHTVRHVRSALSGRDRM
jgi:hypothetical protein